VKTDKPIVSGIPPAGSNRLAKEVGRRLKLGRARKKLDLQQAAKQLGIDPGFYYYLETGRTLANDGMYTRIRDWLLYGTTYEDMGPPKVAASPWTPRDEWPLVKTRIPRQLKKKVVEASQQLNLSIAAIVHLALAQFTANGALIKNLTEAAREIEEARITQLINSSVALRNVLESDPKIFATEKGKPASKLEKLEPAIKQVAQLPLESIDETDQWEI
jgi:hypothetical protein